MLDVPIWLWATFGIGVVVMLAVDLFAHRKAHVIGFREAAKWSAVWVALSLAFAGLVWAVLGAEAGVEFTTAWLLEKSLSVDNLFVFALIFGYFAVPKQYQHRALFYGVIGALIFRAVFIAAGVAIISKFTVVLFVFAAILLWSAYKLMKDNEDDYDPSTNIAVRLVRKVLPVQDEYVGAKFFVKKGLKWVATPMLVVVVAIEAADLVFAVDSVPAVLAVSDDTFIVYSSNAFAILGLRALYFLLAGMLDRFRYLSKGLAIILAFIGVKLILQAAHKTVSTAIPEIPSLVSLAVVVLVLAGAVVLSLRHPPEVTAAEEESSDASDASASSASSVSDEEHSSRRVR
jgi:tellurite resistance protein TerC